MASGDQITLALVMVAQNKSQRQEDSSEYSMDVCDCDKCGLNLDENIDYEELDNCFDHHYNHFDAIEDIGLSRVLSSTYKYDNRLIKFLNQTFGENDPHTTETILMSFACYALYSRPVNPYVLTFWYRALKKYLKISHGETHPLYELLTKAYSDCI